MFTLDEKIIEDAFYAAGFDDVMFDEGCVARRAAGAAGSIWEVVLDKAGRVKATRTRAEGEPQSSTQTVHDRSAHVLIEHSETTTVMFQIDDASELVEFLTTLDRIEKSAATKPAEAQPSDEDIWADEDTF